MKRISKKSALTVTFALGGLLLLLVRRANAAHNYSADNFPFYFGNLAPTVQQESTELTVLSYNIRFAENIDQAIGELEDFQSERTIDILLLQEMDAKGVEQIANVLSLNYVYFPAAIHIQSDKDIGNAILARWPISDAEKLILPHKSISSTMNRTATRARVNLNGMDILVYSIHAETVATFPHFRQNQFQAVLADVPTDTEYAIIGGDFNTVTLNGVKKIEDRYEPAGFLRATQDSTHSVVRFNVEAPADQIFSKGFSILANGNIPEASASDHLPVWATLESD